MSESESRSALHAVVYYPELDSPELDEFRQEYDPFATVIREHLTFVFPVPVESEQVCDHVRSMAADVEPFEIHIGGLNRTWDHWLYLEIQEGHDEVVDLHDRLYTGPLRQFLRSDLPYKPHIGIGFFGRGPYDPLNPEAVELDAQAYDTAREAAVRLKIDTSRRINSITAVKLHRGENEVEFVQDIRLGSGPEKPEGWSP